MVARRHAARHLHIDVAILDPIPGHDFADHHGKRPRPERRRDLQFGERIGKPLEMAFLVDQAAAKNFADFIDTIGELVAAVIDMNHGVAVQHIAAIDISYFAHAPARDFMGEEKVTLQSSARSGRPPGSRSAFGLTS